MSKIVSLVKSNPIDRQLLFTVKEAPACDLILCLSLALCRSQMRWRTPREGPPPRQLTHVKRHLSQEAAPLVVTHHFILSLNRYKSLIENQVGDCISNLILYYSHDSQKEPILHLNVSCP